jgi:hypothetical protein
MAKQSSKSTQLVKINEQALDAELRLMVHQVMSDVVQVAEGDIPRINYIGYASNATQHLVSQMLTDAVFNQDIYVIQTIINRVDGGLPKDVDLHSYQTLFGDCMKQVLAMDKAEQTKVMPDDTVMLALCKSLYDMAARDIYVDPVSKKKRNPSAVVKQERDSALRLVLERSGGRKTSIATTKTEQPAEVAPWIKALHS